jgi:hypothetical protein
LLKPLKFYSTGIALRYANCKGHLGSKGILGKNEDANKRI